MNVWQVLVMLFAACGCFILGRQWGYDSAMQDIREILDQCAEMAEKGALVKIKEDADDDL